MLKAEESAGQNIPVSTLAPRSSDELLDAVRWAVSAGEAVEIVCGASKRTLGRPVSAAHVLDVSALSGIVSYEPSELVLTARAGTPLRVIEAALAERAQCLAFEPPDLAPLLGSSGEPSFGGVVAVGLSGPRRFRAGAARDHVLGISAVSGRGEAFVAGGRVVKNVTGYDLPKLMTGSYGTLAVLTEITVKVLPAPQDTRTLCVAGLGITEGVRAMTNVLQSAVDASGACHLPADIALPGKPVDISVTAFRLEGFTPSVEFRLGRLRESLGALGSLTVLERDESQAFWRAVRDVQPFANSAANDVWRISVPSADGASVAEDLRRTLSGARLFLDWGGGLIWLAVPAAGAESAAAIREALRKTGGHATLVRAPASVRASVEVFEPQPPALAAISRRVKEQFDPARTLNPGRMYASL